MKFRESLDDKNGAGSFFCSFSNFAFKSPNFGCQSHRDPLISRRRRCKDALIGFQEYPLLQLLISDSNKSAALSLMGLHGIPVAPKWEIWTGQHTIIPNDKTIITAKYGLSFGLIPVGWGRSQDRAFCFGLDGNYCGWKNVELDRSLDGPHPQNSFISKCHHRIHFGSVIRRNEARDQRDDNQ
jgi:hypothetical protein